MSDNSQQRKSGNPVITLVLLALLIFVAVVGILALLGPAIGNVFSNTVIETQGWIRPVLGF